MPASRRALASSSVRDSPPAFALCVVGAPARVVARLAGVVAGRVRVVAGWLANDWLQQSPTMMVMAQVLMRTPVEAIRSSAYGIAQSHKRLAGGAMLPAAAEHRGIISDASRVARCPREKGERCVQRC